MRQDKKTNTWTRVRILERKARIAARQPSAPASPKNWPALREIVPVQRPRSLLSRCEIRTQKQQGTMSGIYHAQRKTRPVGTISHKGMHVGIAHWFIKRIKEHVFDPGGTDLVASSLVFSSRQKACADLYPSSSRCHPTLARIASLLHAREVELSARALES